MRASGAAALAGVGLHPVFKMSVISTTSLITRSCWQCHVLPVAMSKTASQTGARVLLPLLDLQRSKSQLHAWKRLRLKDPGTFFFQTCCAPAHCPLDVTVARQTCASKKIGKERGSPQDMSNALGKTSRCLVGVVLFALLDIPVFAGALPSRQRPGPCPPNRDV